MDDLYELFRAAYWMGGCVFLLFSLATVVEVVMLSRLKLTRFTLPDDKSDERVMITNASKEWADIHGFIFEGYYLAHKGADKTFIAAWKNPERSTYFCHYVFQNGISFDLVTEYEERFSLTTGSTLNSQLLPVRPISYQQSFSGVSLNELWQKHLETEVYLMNVGRIQRLSSMESFEKICPETLKKQSKFVRSLFLWPMRGPYWFFIRRYKRHNLTVRQQVEKGWVRLPTDLSPKDRLRFANYSA